MQKSLCREKKGSIERELGKYGLFGLWERIGRQEVEGRNDGRWN